MSYSPLANRVRPNTLKDFYGQKHLIGEGKPFQKILVNNHLPSIIMWGPPGVGKTTLTTLICKNLNRDFFKVNATESGVKEIREIIKKTKKNNLLENPVLFIDEIHRFNKTQQDTLLESVEKGFITLIGATTENPSFEITSPLLSRCQIYKLKKLDSQDLTSIINQSIQNDVILKKIKIKIKEYESLIKYSNGDARRILNYLELIVKSENKKSIIIDNQITEKILGNINIEYDKKGNLHYDSISAFIKSIRGSDPNAAVYWLARMIEGGEDIKFIARRMIILASEDIGNANPNALLLANNCFQAINNIGMPESRIIMAQTAIYLSCSEKSNSAYKAINEAQKEVQKTGNLEVPIKLTNQGKIKKQDKKNIYEYPHDFNKNFIKQEYMPDKIKGKTFYHPGTNNHEIKNKVLLKKLWENKYDY